MKPDTYRTYCCSKNEISPKLPQSIIDHMYGEDKDNPLSVGDLIAEHNKYDKAFAAWKENNKVTADSSCGDHVFNSRCK